MIDTKPFVQTLDGKPVAVLGLGLSGLATAKALLAGGAKVMGWDDRAETRIAAQREAIPLFDFVSGGLDGYAALVMAPGIPLTHPEPHAAVVKAKEAGVEILGDIEILHRCHHGLKIVGITGTNGKSTTTALVTHILNGERTQALMGGNIGKPVLALDLTPDIDTLVLEISSYQMDLCPTFRPDIAVLLNITPDHLDRHGSLDGYAVAKERMLEGAGTAIIGVDDAPSAAIYNRAVKAGMREVIPVSAKQKVDGGVYLDGGTIVNAIGELDTHMRPVATGTINDIPSLPGSHNLQNLCAAYAVCYVLNMAPMYIEKHARTYPGLPHRQKNVRVINGVNYVNDSKATNYEATEKALLCYGNIYLIAGGQPKEGGLKGIEMQIDRIRHVFLIGQAADDFAKFLHKVGIAHTLCHTLDVAVLAAHTMAQSDRGAPGGAGTVLLSPACASWDQFKSFEQRGDTFETLVQSLSEETAL